MDKTASVFHEDFTRAPAAERSSDRTFGFVFAAVFSIVAMAPMVSGRSPRWWAGAIALGVLVVALLVPRLLRPLNRGWAWVGARLHQIVSPIALGVLFGVFIVIGWLMGRRRHEALGMRFDPARQSYWVTRDPPGPAPETMRRQF